MADIISSLFYFGGRLRGFPPTISPSLDDFEMMQYMRHPLKSAADHFRILINVNLFQPHEVEIYVLKNQVIEIHAKHDRRQNIEGLWMTRDCNYTFEIPSEVSGRELHAQWSEDDYLLIQPTSSECAEECEKLRLVPERVQSILKPDVEISVVKEFIEDIRDRARQVLRYIRHYTFEDTGVKMHKEDQSNDEQERKLSSANDSPLNLTEEN